MSGLLPLTKWGWVFLDLWCCSDASMGAGRVVVAEEVILGLDS